MCRDGSGAHDGRMMNIEVMQVLVAERQRDLRRSARTGRIARSLRRDRRHHADHRANAARAGPSSQPPRPIARARLYPPRSARGARRTVPGHGRPLRRARPARRLLGASAGRQRSRWSPARPASARPASSRSWSTARPGRDAVVLAGQADPGTVGRPLELFLDALDGHAAESADRRPARRRRSDADRPAEERVRAGVDLVRRLTARRGRGLRRVRGPALGRLREPGRVRAAGRARRRPRCCWSAPTGPTACPAATRPPSCCPGSSAATRSPTSSSAGSARPT